MGYAYQPSCAGCGASWPEFVVEHGNERAAYCSACDRFVSLHRIWYSTQYEPCSGCGHELSDAVTVDTDNKHPFRCPSCKRSDVQFDCCAHLFIVDEPPALKVGATVEARFDQWAIVVPDLPAIPLTHLRESSQIDMLNSCLLIVTSVPGPGGSDRDYHFAIAPAGR